MNEYKPNYVSAPGETIREMLCTKPRLGSRNCLKDENWLYNRLKWYGVTREGLQDILSGKSAITPPVAKQLQISLGCSAEFWLERERLYREWLWEVAASKPKRRRKKRKVNCGAVI